MTAPKASSKEPKKHAMRTFFLRIVFLAIILRFAFDVLVGVMLEFEDYSNPDTVTDYALPEIAAGIAPEDEEKRNLLELHQKIQQKRAAPLLQKQPVDIEGPYDIVDTSRWAKPSKDYIIDTRDLWEHKEEIPEWMKQYFRWHKENVQADWSSRDAMLPDDQIFLWVTCLKDYRKCGGTADRLMPLPFFIKVAAQTHRILLVQWTKPIELERFLLPPVFGVDWRVPKAKEDALLAIGEKVGTQDTIVEGAFDPKQQVLQVKFQSNDHGSVYYDSIRETEVELRYSKVFHHVWEIFFTPAPALALEIETTMSKIGLVPGGYTSAHIRALYGVDRRSKSIANDWAHNAVHCALYLQQQPEDPLPIFVASDMDAASRQAVSYGRARGVTVLSHHPSMDAPKINPLHLDKVENWGEKEDTDFYDIFVDLYIMSMGKCVTFGQGGFGKFASLMSSNSTCSMYHMTATTSFHCPAPLTKLRRRRASSKHRFKKEIPVGRGEMHSFREAMPAHAVDKEFESHKKKRLVFHSSGAKKNAHRPFPDFTKVIPAEAIWSHSTEIPVWMKDYFAWHTQQRRLLTESNWTESKFLVVACFKSAESCGGIADRLAPIPFLLRLAADSKRLLFIAWGKPRPLEEFLRPPQGGMDWTTPDWLLKNFEMHGEAITDDLKLIHSIGADDTVLSSTLHSVDYGSKYYDAKAMEEGESTTEAFREQFHDCWVSMFTPVDAVAGQVVEQMRKMGTKAGDFSFAHLRAYYDNGGAAEDDETKLRQWTQNSLNCVSGLRPGGPYLFSSDSLQAKEFAMEYGKEKGVKVFVRSSPGEDDQVSLDSSRWAQTDASRYYVIFIDLYMMSFAKCHSYNIGGIAKLANLMSGNGASCAARHWTDGVEAEAANKNGCIWTTAASSSKLELPKLPVRQAIQFLPPIRHSSTV